MLVVSVDRINFEIRTRKGKRKMSLILPRRKGKGYHVLIRF